MAFPRRARRVWASLRAEKRTLRQGLAALTISTLASFVAGLTLGHITDTLTQLPGLLVLIPAAVGMRGTIFGAIGARLGTSTHAGLFEVTLDRNGVLYQNIEVAVITTFTSALWLAILARLATLAFGQRSISIWDFVTISVVGGALGSIFILLFTIALSVLSYRRGYDLDAVSTPMVTALGDMGTLPTLFLATFITRNHAVNAIVAAVCVVVCVYSLVRAITTDLKPVRRIVAEMVAVILLTPLLDIAAGAVLQAKEPVLTAFPGLLILIPPFVSQAGALGGILSSRLSSKLQLGLITTRGFPESPALLDAGLVIVFGVAIFTFIGAVALVLANITGLAHPGAGTMVGGTLLAGVLALPVVIGVGYYLAIVTSRFGLDPDNQSVPIITSVMDLVGVAAVLIAMATLGVTING